jgi:hypothetical protein
MDSLRDASKRHRYEALSPFMGIDELSAFFNSDGHHPSFALSPPQLHSPAAPVEEQRASNDAPRLSRSRSKAKDRGKGLLDTSQVHANALESSRVRHPQDSGASSAFTPLYPSNDPGWIPERAGVQRFSSSHSSEALPFHSLDQYLPPHSTEVETVHAESSHLQDDHLSAPHPDVTFGPFPSYTLKDLQALQELQQQQIHAYQKDAVLQGLSMGPSESQLGLKPEVLNYHQKLLTHAPPLRTLLSQTRKAPKAAVGVQSKIEAFDINRTNHLLIRDLGPNERCWDKLTFYTRKSITEVLQARRGSLYKSIQLQCRRLLTLGQARLLLSGDEKSIREAMSVIYIHSTHRGQSWVEEMAPKDVATVADKMTAVLGMERFKVFDFLLRKSFTRTEGLEVLFGGAEKCIEMSERLFKRGDDKVDPETASGM